MSEARCRADHGGYLADGDHDRVPSWVTSTWSVATTSTEPTMALPSMTIMRICSAVAAILGKPGPKREHVAALLDATRRALLHRPDRRIEHDLHKILAPVDAGEVRPCVDDSARKGVGAGLGTHPLSAVNQLEDASREVEPPPPEQLGQLLVLRSLVQPLPPDP